MTDHRTRSGSSPKVLSIAGSDPSGGAGIQADLKTFQALGAFGMALPAALTAQNSGGVAAVAAVPARFFSAQLQTLLTDIRPDGVKTGMLLSAAAVLAVSRAIRHHSIMNLVVDPVIVSTSGKPLLTLSARKAIKEHLLPLAVIVTPNLSEAEALSGMKIMNEQDRDYAAGRILDLGPSYVLIKGGHGPSAEAEDVLYGGPQVMTFSTPRRKGSFHGTGCVLSSAITVFIARGYAVEKAVEKGKQFVDRLLKAAMPVGRNRKTLYFQM